MDKNNISYGNYYSTPISLVACRIFPGRESRKASKREIKRKNYEKGFDYNLY